MITSPPVIIIILINYYNYYLRGKNEQWYDTSCCLCDTFQSLAYYMFERTLKVLHVRGQPLEKE